MYQFTHAEGYALSAATKVRKDKNGKVTSTPKSNVAGIIAEVLRDEEACTHVENPQPPTFHFGDEATMRGLEAKLENRMGEWNQQLRTEGKRALRKDTQVLFTQVSSYEKGGPDMARWRELAVEKAKKDYGDNLVAIIEHRDEQHPHIHIYVTPIGQSPDVKTIHPGHVAAAGITEPKLQMAAFKRGMRAFQDDYFRDVGAQCGMTRVGAGKGRKRHGEAVADREQAERIRLVYVDIAQQREAIAKDLERIGSYDEMEKRGAALDMRELEIERKAAAIGREQLALHDAQGALSTDQRAVDIAKANNEMEKRSIERTRADIEKLRVAGFQAQATWLRTLDRGALSTVIGLDVTGDEPIVAKLKEVLGTETNAAAIRSTIQKIANAPVAPADPAGGSKPVESVGSKLAAGFKGRDYQADFRSPAKAVAVKPEEQGHSPGDFGM